LVALAAAALSACGDEEAQELAFTLSGEGKAAKLSGPTGADSGLAEITFDNESGKDADLQLLRVEGDRSAEETAEGLKKATRGQPFPDWFFAGGGAGATPADGSRTVTQVLEPGTYYAFDVEGDLDPKSALAIEVGGETSDEEVEADATVSAFEYGFESDSLTGGNTEVVFENTGAQPHHIVYAPLKGDARVADVKSFLKTEKGKPPFEDKEIKSTAVIEGGEAQLVTLELESGRYALLCFISDRQGGPPHAIKGMVGEVEVE
jgi:plastocyanin